MKNRLRYLPYVFLLALLPVMVLRDFTPSNELRYLSIADEALRDGRFFAFTNQGEPYADKPPLYLWLVMLGKTLFGGHRMWFLALFSFVPAMVILRTMDRWVRSELDERARFCGAMMLMSSALFLGLAVFLRMDMLMCMFITLALHAFWRIYSSPDGGSSRDRTLFPVFVFAALFTKGPVGVLVPLLSTVVFLAVTKRLRTLGRYWGLRSWAILSAGCALWFFMVWRDGGTEYLNNLLFHQTIDRAVDAFHHKAPVYYYLITMWYSLAPWSLLIACVWGTAAAERVRLTDLEKFFVAIILCIWRLHSRFSSIRRCSCRAVCVATDGLRRPWRRQRLCGARALSESSRRGMRSTWRSCATVGALRREACSLCRARGHWLVCVAAISRMNR